MKKLSIFIFILLILLMTGCNNNNQSAYTKDEVAKIVDETLTQAELANQELLTTMGREVLFASLIRWQHQPIEIITNEPNKLEVMLQGEFILTGTQDILPLTLNKQNNQWQTDDSFCPQEQQLSDYYYTQEEVQGIIEDVLYRVNKAKNAYNDDATLFQEAFLCEAAMFYYRNWEQLNQSSWQADDYQIWLNTSDKIVIIMQNNNVYRPLNIYKVDDHWLTDESYAIQGSFDAVPAILPFSESDVRFPFDSQITPEQFIKNYGQPLNTQIGEFLYNTDFITYNYADFSITWLNWFNEGHYIIHNFKTQTSDFWYEVRGIRLGDSMDSVIKKFHHCKPYDNIDPVFGVQVIYGLFEHMADYGLIDGNQLVYTADSVVFKLTFGDDHLTSMEFQYTNY